ncbi:ABC-F family ATP-binding cassette domain-containing protein [Vannielia litorea]|uniref:ABC-F family ATP-binding cassette domain-containing protein n=1 Tax=Vannielia litorea TaxID=1217970 RepID=UPI001C951929|nr:ABC-F family ATP-binding cassette domain-containing protein [Vannielia litorea]MBY6049571.1 ATP-binding cassette domain-containing protein [Vannielia litorea]MBY6076985.1 ATP-binding cassette domain-containing protein [Vannielia litorea]
MPAISLSAVPLTAPDGTALTPPLTLSFGSERTGLVGPNGAGKSTLLALLASGTPAAGQIDRQATAGQLLQSWPDLSQPVAAALGQAEPLARLARIEAGTPAPDDLDHADWHLPARIEDALSRAGLPKLDPSRALATLSGGQRTRIGLARLLLDAPDILLMDEPTNNLDAEGRALVTEIIATWPGGVVVASHDRTLLEWMDRVVEITPQGIHVTGGGWQAHLAERDARRNREAEALDRAKREEARVSRELQAAREKAAQRAQAGKKLRASGSQPKVLTDAMADRAGRTQGADRRRAERLEAAAQAAREAAAAHVSPARALSIEAEATRGGATVLRLEALTITRGDFLLGPITAHLAAGERVALTGPNGAGKSTLIAALRGRMQPASGRLTVTPATATLDQHAGDLDPARSLLANLRNLHPEMETNAAHALLARYGFRGATSETPVARLSGGEKLRAALAVTLGGTPPALLLLDEPTNHLDIETVELLEEALRGYTGALLVASHDTAFIANIGLKREITL